MGTFITIVIVVLVAGYLLLEFAKPKYANLRSSVSTKVKSINRAIKKLFEVKEDENYHFKIKWMRKWIVIILALCIAIISFFLTAFMALAIVEDAKHSNLFISVIIVPVLAFIYSKNILSKTVPKGAKRRRKIDNK